MNLPRDFQAGASLQIALWVSQRVWRARHPQPVSPLLLSPFLGTSATTLHSIETRFRSRSCAAQHLLRHVEARVCLPAQGLGGSKCLLRFLFLVCRASSACMGTPQLILPCFQSVSGRWEWNARGCPSTFAALFLSRTCLLRLACKSELP